MKLLKRIDDFLLSLIGPISLTKKNLRLIVTGLVVLAVGYEVQQMLQNAIDDFNAKKRPDYSRLGRVRVRKGTKSGFRADGILWDDDEDNWLVKTIDI